MTIAPVRINLSALIYAELQESSEADPHVIAEQLIAKLSEDDLREVVAVTLPAHVRRHIHSLRSRVSSEASAASSDAPSGGGNRSARWEAIAAAYESGELDELRLRVFACGAWKFLGDCTREDVADIAEQHDVAVAQRANVARRYHALHAAMKRKRAKTVRDLPLDAVREIFHA